jgi:hypothetical protein
MINSTYISHLNNFELNLSKQILNTDINLSQNITNLPIKSLFNKGQKNISFNDFVEYESFLIKNLDKIQVLNLINLFPDNIKKIIYSKVNIFISKLDNMSDFTLNRHEKLNKQVKNKEIILEYIVKRILKRYVLLYYKNEMLKNIDYINNKTINNSNDYLTIRKQIKYISNGIETFKNMFKSKFNVSNFDRDIVNIMRHINVNRTKYTDFLNNLSQNLEILNTNIKNILQKYNLNTNVKEYLKYYYNLNHEYAFNNIELLKRDFNKYFDGIIHTFNEYEFNKNKNMVLKNIELFKTNIMNLNNFIDVLENPKQYIKGTYDSVLNKKILNFIKQLKIYDSNMSIN